MLVAVSHLVQISKKVDAQTVELKVVRLLGCGATSFVYEADMGGERVVVKKPKTSEAKTSTAHASAADGSADGSAAAGDAAAGDAAAGGAAAGGAAAGGAAAGGADGGMQASGNPPANNDDVIMRHINNEIHMHSVIHGKGVVELRGLSEEGILIKHIHNFILIHDANPNPLSPNSNFSRSINS